MTDKQQANFTEKLTLVNAVEVDSVERALAGDDQPWLTDGYDWKDKPHRVMWKAIEEIRALRIYIIKNSKIANE